MLDFNVVFVGAGIEKGGNYFGVRTISSYASSESFEESLRKGGLKDMVLAKGVTREVAIEIAGRQPIRFGVAAAVTRACSNEDHHFDIKVFEMGIGTLFATLSDHQQGELIAMGTEACLLSGYGVPEARRAFFGLKKRG